MDLPDSASSLKRMSETRLKKLRQIGPMIAGSIVDVPERYACYLTDKVRGKTRTVCIPKELVDEVGEWNENYREAKRLVQELDEIQRAVLRKKIEAVRAARKRA